MDALRAFLNLEVNNAIKKKILDTIYELSRSDVESRELVFNIYSLTIYPKRNEVLISNDIIDEQPNAYVSLDEFRKAIKQFEKK
jgi:hypothetical protein